MAGQTTTKQPQSNAFLSPNQQELLLAALTSQANGGTQSTYPPVNGNGIIKRSSSDPANQQLAMSGIGSAGLFMSPQQDSGVDTFGIDDTPYLDYLDGDNSFDFDNPDLNDDMIGDLPGDEANEDGRHEKRKSHDEGSEEGDHKRQEKDGDEKGAKKPGRKPLTSEPTTKRKAQNRAAQRAFRERKEKHLKDLETKVDELTKMQEADKHENGLLKAQVERLQTELKESRKRLSLNGSGVKGSPPLAASYGGAQRSNSGPTASNNNFQFEFPKFGGLPGSQIFGAQAVTNGTSAAITKRESTASSASTQSPLTNGNVPTPPPAQLRHSSTGRSMSPKAASGNAVNNVASSMGQTSADAWFMNGSANMQGNGFSSTLPQMNGGGMDGFGDLFSPSIMKSMNQNNNFDGGYFSSPQAVPNIASTATEPSGTDTGTSSTSGLSRVFQFNSNSNSSDSASPSASSLSQWNANGNSSCGTSPEPSHGSPAKGADMLNTGLHGTNGTTDYNVPSANAFDPVLFGDYRDSNDAIVGGSDFTGGFFDEALNPGPYDFGSPSNLFGILQSPQQANTQVPASQKFLDEVNKNRDGVSDDYGCPNSKKVDENSSAKLISCNNIWNQLQQNQDFQDGKFDLDNLCSELRAKARCSESGVMVDQNHVDQALRKLGKKHKQAQGPPADLPPLMFEQESWDNVLKKLQGGQA